MFELSGKTFGVVGIGRIGLAAARLATAVARRVYPALDASLRARGR
jgi:phosphoglycerate dehydrogenase-like enzyme